MPEERQPFGHQSLQGDHWPARYRDKSRCSSHVAWPILACISSLA